jgi:uncharacterized Zn ribbon protein
LENVGLRSVSRRQASLGSSNWKEEDENKVIHRDSNGVILEVGDSVV